MVTDGYIHYFNENIGPTLPDMTLGGEIVVAVQSTIFLWEKVCIQGCRPNNLMDFRDHSPVRINDFNGLWKRGDETNVPLDHFTDCNNIIYKPGGFQTRPGMEIAEFGDAGMTIPNVRRMYIYNRDSGQSFLVLDINGNFYHTGSPTPLVPILTIPEATDFTFVAIAERAYISPHDGRTGLEDEFVYVYMGDGEPARKAAGFGPTTAVTLATGGIGNIEPGVRIFGVIYETDTGFQTKISPLSTITTVTVSYEIDITDIPISPDPVVVARHIVAARAVNATKYNNDPSSYELFFVPDGRIPDNTTTSLTVNFFDVELLDEASSLLDLLEEIPAVVNLNTYRERMTAANSFGEFDIDPDEDTSYLLSTIRVSKKGEPEAFDSVSGVLTVPQDGYPLTGVQEYRDIMYVFKEIRTYSYNDNGDDPSSWPLTIIDQGSGASVHGIATVMDSGGINIDFLLLVNFNGIMMFTGTYIKPELTYKIETEWMLLNREQFKVIQIVNSSLSKNVYCVLPDNRLLYGTYQDGLDPMKMKWAPWTFTEPLILTTIALYQVDKLALGFLQGS